jgi:hypothetical protein
VPAQLGGERGPLLLLQVEDGHGGPAGGQRPDGGLAEAGGPSGDDSGDVEALHAPEAIEGAQLNRDPCFSSTAASSCLTPLGVGDRADHRHVGGVDDDAVADADQRHQVVRVVAEDDVAGAVEGDRQPRDGVLPHPLQRLRQGRPRADVQPLDVEVGHQHPAGLGRGRLQDGVVDADPRQRREHLGEDGVPLRAGRRGDDAGQALGAGRQVVGEGLEHGGGPPDEHAGVPQVLPRGEVGLRGGAVGLLAEGRRLRDAGHAGRCAALHVAEPGGRRRGPDAEGHQRARALGEGVVGGGERRGEPLDRPDHVVGADHGELGVGVDVGHQGRGQADGVGGVPGDRLEHQPVRPQPRQRGAHLLPVAGRGADPDAVGRQHRLEPGEGLGQQAVRRAVPAGDDTVADDVEQLLGPPSPGTAATAASPNRRP